VAAVVLARQERGEALRLQSARVRGTGVVLQERQAYRAVDLVEDHGRARPTTLKLIA
jgi:hypothetical protein